MAKFGATWGVVDAFRWTGGPDQDDDPTWICAALEDGRAAIVGTRAVVKEIMTAYGVATAQLGDWIVRKVDGGLSVAQPDDFARACEAEQ